MRKLPQITARSRGQIPAGQEVKNVDEGTWKENCLEQGWEKGKHTRADGERRLKDCGSKHKFWGLGRGRETPEHSETQGNWVPGLPCPGPKHSPTSICLHHCRDGQNTQNGVVYKTLEERTRTILRSDWFQKPQKVVVLATKPSLFSFNYTSPCSNI